VHRTPSLCRWLVISLIATAIAASGVRAQSESAGPRTPVVVEVRRDGFHWGDAGVGAAAALAIVAIAAGVAIVIRGRAAQETS
jgi:hypothetical protein